MVSTSLKIIVRPAMKDPVMVSGLPGSGYVGKLAVEHLIKELKAELFCEVYSDLFPPQVYIKQDGSVDIIKNELYYWKSDGKGRDLMLYTGDAQPITPEAEFDTADKVLSLAYELGVKRVYSLAAYILGTFVEKPKVYATATEMRLLKELEPMGVIKMREGSITGMNGLLIGLAKLKGMGGICLLGETSGYVVDAKAAQAVLEVLTKLLKLSIDLSGLERRAREAESAIKTIQELQRRGQERPQPQPQADTSLGYIS